MQTKTFQIAPGSTAAAWIFGPLIVFLVALAGAFVYFVVGAKTVTLDDSGLRVEGAFYSATVARDRLQGDQARLIDLATDAAYRPHLRTNGIELMSFKEGWFRLHNGDKALLVVTRPGAVVYVPTREGYAILVSPADPRGLLAALQTGR